MKTGLKGFLQFTYKLITNVDGPHGFLYFYLSVLYFIIFDHTTFLSTFGP